jgi:hypothetical protein
MGKIWELDFYSRPILDERQKKRWEVLVCEAPMDIETKPETLFRYSKFCSNTEVNSVWLRTALQEAMEQANASPNQIRFFRQQMSNMIIKTCSDLGITARPSRRTVVLNQWLKQRHAEFYPQQPGYQDSSNPSVNYPDSPPKPLPDALIGQSWAFVSLEARAFQDMADWDIGFGEAFPLSLVDLAPDARIPGVLIFSPRAVPLAGWMSGLELGFLRFDAGDRPRLVLETGFSDGWVLADLPTPSLQAEAKGFIQSKQQANGVHFIAVQSKPESESFAGFWIMQELDLA